MLNEHFEPNHLVKVTINTATMFLLLLRSRTMVLLTFSPYTTTTSTTTIVLRPPGLCLGLPGLWLGLPRWSVTRKVKPGR